MFADVEDKLRVSDLTDSAAQTFVIAAITMRGIFESDIASDGDQLMACHR